MGVWAPPRAVGPLRQGVNVVLNSSSDRSGARWGHAKTVVLIKTLPWTMTILFIQPGFMPARNASGQFFAEHVIRVYRISALASRIIALRMTAPRMRLGEPHVD